MQRIDGTYWSDETAVGTVEIILILVVCIGLVVVFKQQLTKLVDSIFTSVNNKAKTIYQ